ncbi:MAG TPA: universal stress protein [Verrucomicrobiae bacterium]|nr:universal stress protein [Verrucomicrobiae bacterium]
MITLKRILAPTDFSIITVPAIGYALSLAKELGAEVTVLHALPTEVMKEQFMNQYATGDLAGPAAAPIGLTRTPDFDGIFERKKQVLRTFLEQRISKELLGAVKINPVIKIGKVAEEIVAVAKEEQCDLIVMTSHGSRLRRLLHGSFTDRVILLAPCPVLSIQPWTEIRTEENKRVAVKLIDKWAA